MTTHGLWLDIILKPKLLDNEFISGVTESETFDLLVHLINNGINLLSSLTQNNSTDETKKNIENKKYNIIRILAFKLVSHFNWDLHKILNTLPSIHQEFLFNEFKRFCEQEKVPDDWKIFSVVLYHRWVLQFVLKSVYPCKPQKIGIISANQQLLDPYFVPPEIQESLIKKYQAICINSLADIEKIVSEFDNGRIFDISMPLFDCFTLNEIDKMQNMLFAFDKSNKFDKESFLDELFYELGKWHFIHEDYGKANNYFDRIVVPRNSFLHLDGFKLAAQAMNSKDYKITEPKELENCEKKITKYLQTIVKDHENVYEFDPIKSNELKKVILALKKFNDSCRTKQDIFLCNRLSTYLIFKINGLYDVLDQNSRGIFLNIDKNNDGTDEGEVIEEGEINADEELTNDDDPELMLLEAIEPENILSLIPSIKKAPLTINSKWVLPENHMMLIRNLSQSEYFKCHIILAKAKELRNAKYFVESRVLYLSLMEDIQTSNPHLADVIQYELLHTDLEIFFNTNDVDERMMAELEPKCLVKLRTIDSHRYPFFRETVELACVFLVDNFASIKEFVNCQIDIMRFCACLSYLNGDFSRENDKRAKEFWEFCLTSFISSNSKFPLNYARISFHCSFESFISKFKNTKVIGTISTCLAKIYNLVKDNPSQMITIHSQFDNFPFSIPSNLLSVIDIKAVCLVVDKTFRNYIDTNPSDLQLLKYYGDYLLAEGLYYQAMKYFVRIVMLNTKYFSFFDYIDSDELIVQQMITCSAKMGAHIQAAVLYQLSRDPDYGLAFKELNQQISFDSSDDLYECIWDVTLLEYLVNHHYRRGDDERRLKVTRLMAQLDLNINNDDAILKEAANLRKNKLFRMLSKQYL